MMLTRTLCHRLLVVVALTAAGALGCRDSATTDVASHPGITDPAFTAGVGFTSTPAGRANLGRFDVNSMGGKCLDRDGGNGNGCDRGHKSEYSIELKSNDNTDVVVATIVVDLGGTSGWHTHPGPAVVVVKSGTITTYQGGDPTCSPNVHPTGTSFIEGPDMVHVARNEGTVPVNLVTTYFVPAGAATRVDAPDPGNCPF